MRDPNEASWLTEQRSPSSLGKAHRSDPDHIPMQTGTIGPQPRPTSHPPKPLSWGFSMLEVALAWPHSHLPGLVWPPGPAMAALSLSEAERSMASDQSGHLEGGRHGLLSGKAIEAAEESRTPPPPDPAQCWPSLGHPASASQGPSPWVPAFIRGVSLQLLLPPVPGHSWSCSVGRGYAAWVGVCARSTGPGVLSIGLCWVDIRGEASRVQFQEDLMGEADAWCWPGGGRAFHTWPMHQAIVPGAMTGAAWGGEGLSPGRAL